MTEVLLVNSARSYDWRVLQVVRACVAVATLHSGGTLKSRQARIPWSEKIGLPFE